MKLLRCDYQTSPESYGGRQSPVFPEMTAHLPKPFHVAVGMLMPGQCSTMHAHAEGEVFVIMDGHARIQTEDEEAFLYGGDAVELATLQRHRVCNMDPVKRLSYLKIWWLGDQGPSHMPKEVEYRPVLVTATPPTPNGDLHLGHLSGPYLRADIYTRYLRLMGRPAVYQTGLDDHQSYVATKASSLCESPAVTAGRYGRMIEEAWAAADIVPDFIGKPRESGRHAALVSEVLKDLFRRGHILEREAPSLVCSRCGLSLFEAHVSGICPHCGSASNGNACEVCCRPNDVHDLIEPRCTACGGEGAPDRYRRLFFRLSNFAPKLRDYLSHAFLPARIVALAERMLADGLPDISISHRTTWGIPVPLEGYADQRLYVWFEMAAGYVAATRDHAAAAPDTGALNAWQTPEFDIVQFFGMDNAYFHAVLFPAIYMAMGTVANIPRHMLTNEFLRFDGRKFSTSRNHAIWAADFLKQEPSDLVRYYLALVGPETSQTNFTVDAYKAEVESEVRGLWYRWLADLDAVLATSFSGRAPEVGLWLPDQRAFLNELSDVYRAALTSFERDTFSPSRAVRCARELVRASQRFAESQTSLAATASLGAEWRTAIALQLAAALRLAVITRPIMPRFAIALLTILYGNARIDKLEPHQVAFVRAGTEIRGLAGAVP